MNAIHRILISSFLVLAVFCGVGEATKAYTYDDVKTLVYQPVNMSKAAVILQIGSIQEK